MIKNFKDFDAKTYLKSRVLNEAIDKEDENIEYREITVINFLLKFQELF